MNEDERDEIAGRIEREMSITIKHTSKGWKATVTAFGADIDCKKRHDYPDQALEEALHEYYTIQEEELKTWHER